jgi:hypothetical protein
MKEISRRRITVTSSFKKYMYTDQLGTPESLSGGNVLLRPPHFFLQQASGQTFKDDVNGFSSTSFIYFLQCTLIKKKIYKEIQAGAFANSYMTNGLLKFD